MGSEMCIRDRNMSARAMIAIGYPGDSADLPEKYQDREFPSSREPLESLMFQGCLDRPQCT